MIVNYYIVGHYTFYVEAMLITGLATCEYRDSHSATENTKWQISLMITSETVKWRPDDFHGILDSKSMRMWKDAVCLLGKC